MSEQNPYSSPTEDGVRPPIAKSQGLSSRLALASLLCALVFPVTFWGITSAEAHGLLGPGPPGARMAVGLLLTLSSLSAVILAVFSFSGGVRSTALIGLIVGTVELFMCLTFSP